MKDIVVLSGEAWRWSLMIILFMVIGAVMWDFAKLIIVEIFRGIVQQQERRKKKMSNICFTNVRLRFQSETEARKMESLITSSLNEEKCDVYQTNDEFLKGKYIIEFTEEEQYQSNREASEETVVTMLQFLLGTEETEIDKLLSQYNEMPISSQMFIRKWEFIPISECS